MFSLISFVILVGFTCALVVYSAYLVIFSMYLYQLSPLACNSRLVVGGVYVVFVPPPFSVQPSF